MSGLVQKDNLAVIKKDEKWLEEELEKNGYSDMDDIFYAEWVDVLSEY